MPRSLESETGLFTYMGIFKKDAIVDPTQPLNETSGSTPPAEEVQAEPSEETQAQVATSPDKGVFNCTACSGTGLIGEPGGYSNSVCTKCQGTGKVS